MVGQKKHQFHFRIPWISGFSSTGSQSHPKSKSPSPKAPPTRISEPQTSLESKMMFATSTSNPSENNTMKDDETNFVNKVATVNPTTQVPMDDKKVSVVTLAGENRGATMHVADSQSQSTKKKGSIHKIHRTNEKEEKEEGGKAYVNSNIQSMNNSFMLQGSLTGRDPGVRVILPQKHEPEVKRGLENRGNEGSNVSRVEKLPYRPTVRRRCLRGLMVEPSDSDPDKPRRHGCKFSCGDVKKDNGIL
ncbi:uncharacterized protein [Cicer arietinum]|uniref:Uncharacterized protein LOC101511994 n=1 Tax=Cicer arietinum TaxID=3827 RepID=A0A1S2YA77_CICAR|nr:uncharacterized protein LOC101511994 [Cicer arietinum]